MLEIILNGEKKRIAPQCTALELTHLLGLHEQRIAMEVNRQVIPRSRYDQFTFTAGDQVEIVRAIGGGSTMTSP